MSDVVLKYKWNNEENNYWIFLDNFFTPMALFSDGLTHNLTLALVKGIGLFKDGFIIDWDFTWQFKWSRANIVSFEIAAY